MFNFNIVEKIRVAVNFKNKKKYGRGGNAGEIFIASRKIRGDGSINAEGGDGSVGGKGGKVSVISEDNQFNGRISVKGGKSFLLRRWLLFLVFFILVLIVSAIIYFL